MNAITWVWFSGTGNTWLAMQAMAAALREQGVAVATRRMETVTEPLELPPGETLGLAFPVACFSSYPLVWRFLKVLPPGGGRDVVLLTTMGGFSGGMAGPLKRFLRAKGYHPRAETSFLMPSNYGNATIPAEANAHRVAQMRLDAAAFAQAVVSRRARWRVGYPLWSTALTALARTSGPWRAFKKFYPLAVDPARCTRCGLCARLCPAGVIQMGADGPVWSTTCESCQRCIGYCPTHAIHVQGKSVVPYTAAPIDVFLGTE